MPLNIIAFNRINLKEWKKELAAIPAQIEACEARIRAAQVEFAHHESDIKAKKEKIQTHQSASKKVSVQIEMASKLDLEAAKLSNLKEEASSHTRSMRLIENEKRQLEKAVNQNQNAISKEEKAISNFRNRDAELRKLIADCKRFMKTAKDDPKSLFESIDAHIVELIYFYETTKPANQSVNLRIFLRELACKVEFIRSRSNLEAEEKQPFAFQLGFLRLCGLLWEMRLLMTGKESDCVERVERILEATHLPRDSVVAFESDIAFPPRTCVNEYAAFKSDFPVPEMAYITNEAMLSALEKKSFADAIIDLQEGGKIAKNFADEVDALADEEINPDLKFYTTVLGRAQAWIINNANNSELKALANHAKGAPSSLEKAASLIFLLLSGASAFVSATAFNAGEARNYANAIHLKVNDSVETKVGSVFGALSGFLGSIGLFCHSRRRGLSQKIVTLAKTTPVVEASGHAASLRQSLL